MKPSEPKPCFHMLAQAGLETSTERQNHLRQALRICSHPGPSWMADVALLMLALLMLESCSFCQVSHATSTFRDRDDE